MKIIKIEFLNGWSGAQSIRIKAMVQHEDVLSAARETIITETILEHDEAEKILMDRLNQGFTLSLKPAQKIHRIMAN